MATLDTVSFDFTVWETIEPAEVADVAVLPPDDGDVALAEGAAGVAGGGALAAGLVPEGVLGERIWLTAESTLVGAGVAIAAAA
ncbi:MAG: hypothetical protein PHX77_07230 [Candidatus Bipolaricaulis sp.]|nr:hypothetical protein [Candidatus Bipolaricaulis sp.]MDD5646618.1 hypothetical protein [Candidatus Bipolaricaulis sp.]